MLRFTSSSSHAKRPAGLLFALLLLWGGVGSWAAAWPAAAKAERPSAEAQLPLEWSPEPGVYELALQRRDDNPLFLPDRRRISPRKLTDAKVRDADGAWQVLDAYIDLASRRGRMARLDSADRIEKAIADIDALTAEALRVGGTAYRIADSLAAMRAALLSQWRAAAAGNPALVSTLDRRKTRRPRTGPVSRFLAQVDQKKGPIPEHELASALLGENPTTIRAVMKSFSAERRRALRRRASLVFADLKREGVETKELEPKLEAMGATF